MKQFTFYPILLSIFFTVLGNVAQAVKNPILIRPSKVSWSYELHFEPESNGSFKDAVELIDSKNGEVAVAKNIFTGKLEFVGVPWGSYTVNSNTDRAPQRSFIKPIRSMGLHILVMASEKQLYIYDTSSAVSEAMSMPRMPGHIEEMTITTMSELYFISVKTDKTEGVWFYDYVEGTFTKVSEKFSSDLTMVFSNNRYEVRGNNGFGKVVNVATRKISDLPKKAALLSTSRALVVVEEKKPGEQTISTGDAPTLTQEQQEALLEKKTKKLALLKKYLDGMVVGQPEALEALINIEVTDFSKGGKRDKPPVTMFIGLPETGKDTSVESYVIAKALLKNSDLPVEQRAKTKEALDGLASDAMTEHLFRVPRVKNEIDVALLIGSGPGYVGSSRLSPLVKWLVKHSGGKYVLDTAKDGSENVKLAANWYPGMVKEGYSDPSEGILFFNEVHDWSKMGKNAIMKEALEKGFFNIRNPGEGVDRLEVPVTIILASNDSIGRVLSINHEGRRVGAPLTFDQQMARWTISHLDFSSLKQDLVRGTPGNTEGGMSAEMISRIPNSRLILMRPLSQDNLIKLTGIKLDRVRLDYAQTKDNGFPWFRISWTQEVPKFIVQYDASSESGARSINDKIETLLTKTINDAIMKRTLKPALGANLPLDIKVNKDGTASLLANNVRYFIEYTKKEKQEQPPTPEEIKALLNVEAQLNARVMGLEHITSQMAEDVRMARNKPKERPADVYMLLGSSSTGKTELAVGLHQVITQSNTKPPIVDGGRIYTKAQIEELILGRKDFRGESIPSLFMQEYDRTNGEMVFVLDEITNAPREVQNALYDLLREAVVTTFSDGKERPMGRVRFVLTGNAGEEWYRGIPREAPEIEQHAAARKIYKKSLNNPGFIRRFLLTHFSEAFINRVQEHRIFFFGPHTHKTIRQLILLKLKKALKEMALPRKGSLNWNVTFLSKEEYIKTIEAVENHGFNLWEQGASITGFVENILMKKVELALLDNLIPANAKVTIVKGEDVMPKDHHEDRVPQIGFKLFVEGRATSIPIVVDGKVVPKKVRVPNRNYILTAYHEAGHELVRHVLHGYRVRSKGIEIVPGVTEINGSWIRYAGIARSEAVEQHEQFARTIIEDIAILAAGYMGESLTVREERSTSGKHNDIQRATQLAQMAVASAGLSADFGVRSRQPTQSLEAYLSMLTEKEKAKFSKAVDYFLKEGEKLARQVIVANMDEFFLPLGQHLAKKGRVSGEVIERFYENKKGLIIHPSDTAEVERREAIYKAKKHPILNRRIDFEFQPFADYQGTVINVDALQAEEKRINQAEADLSSMNELIARAEDLPKFRSALIKEKVIPEGFIGALNPAKLALSRSCQALFVK